MLRADDIFCGWSFLLPGSTGCCSKNIPASQKTSFALYQFTFKEEFQERRSVLKCEVSCMCNRVGETGPILWTLCPIWRPMYKRKWKVRYPLLPSIFTTHGESRRRTKCKKLGEHHGTNSKVSLAGSEIKMRGGGGEEGQWEIAQSRAI